MKRITRRWTGTGWWRVRAARTSLECGFEGTRVGGSRPSGKKRTGSLFPSLARTMRLIVVTRRNPATTTDSKEKDLSPLESASFLPSFHSPFARKYRFLLSFSSPSRKFARDVHGWRMDGRSRDKERKTGSQMEGSKRALVSVTRLPVLYIYIKHI